MALGARRTSGRAWLLIKRRDGAATEDDIVVKKPRSVVSKRLLAEIAFDSGGDIERAARGDPEAEIRALIRNPRRRGRSDHGVSIWHSNK